MIDKIIQLIQDERGAVALEVFPLLAAGAGLAWMAAHGASHLPLAPDIGGLPDQGISQVMPAPEVAGAVATGVAGVVATGVAGAVGGKQGWQWDNEGEIIYVSRNMARDRNMFRVPSKGLKKREQVLHNGEVQDVVSWQWPGDERVFLVPTELFHVARLGGLVRDVISVSGQLFREQGFPVHIITSYRKIAELLGLSFNGRVADEIEMCFAYARCFTVKNHPVIAQIDKTGKVKKQDIVTFGFIDYVARADIRDGKKIPKNRAPVSIVLSALYATALRELPSSPLPVAALEAAHRAPWKLVVPAKNLVYYLASRVPMREIRLLLPTIRDILGFKERSDGKLARTRHAIENTLNILYPVMIDDYQYSDDGYNITLSGKSGNNNVRHNRAKNET